MILWVKPARTDNVEINAINTTQFHKKCSKYIKNSFGVWGLGSGDPGIKKIYYVTGLGSGIWGVGIRKVENKKIDVKTHPRRAFTQAGSSCNDMAALHRRRAHELQHLRLAKQPKVTSNWL